MTEQTTTTIEDNTVTSDVVIPKAFAKIVPDGADIKENGETTTLTLEQMEATISTANKLLESKGKLNKSTKDALKIFRDNVKTSYESAGKQHQLVSAFEPPRHEYSGVFGDMSEDEFNDLIQSMKVNGYLEQFPIVLLNGEILDGHHRYQAAKIAGVEPKFINYDGKDPIAFVKSANADRRHLTNNQRAQIAERLATLSGEKIADVADKFKVSTSMVQRSRYVADRSDTLANAVKDGTLDLHDAQIVARNDKLLGKVNSTDFDIESDLSKVVAAAKKADKATQKRTALSVTLPLEGTGSWQLHTEIFDANGNSLGCGYTLVTISQPATSDDIINYARQAWDKGPDKINKKLVREVLSDLADDLLVSIAVEGGKTDVSMSNTRQEKMVSATEVIMEAAEKQKKIWEAGSEKGSKKVPSAEIMSEEDIENILATLD